MPITIEEFTASVSPEPRAAQPAPTPDVATRELLVERLRIALEDEQRRLERLSAD